jgi:hypothetical protein
LEPKNVDIQPVVVDRLVTFTEEDLQARKMRIEVLLDEYQTRTSELDTQLTKMRETLQFLTVEHEAVVLAIKLKVGDVVRVTCTNCLGTGLKPADVTSGKFLAGTLGRVGSAFEGSGGGAASTVPQQDPALRCTVCKGKKYQTLERFKG